MAPSFRFNNINNFRISSCNSKHDEDICVSQGYMCKIAIDGYYISVGLCVIIGIIWFKIFYNRIQKLQTIPKIDWIVVKNK